VPTRHEYASLMSLTADEWLMSAVSADELLLERLSDRGATAVIDALARRFDERPRGRFWWDALRAPTASLHYGGTPEPFRSCVTILERLVGSPSTTVMLVVGLDEQGEGRGAAVWRGRLDVVTEALGGCPAIEFVVTDPAVSWAIFDTHHDATVVDGRPPGIDELPNIRAALDDPRAGGGVARP